MAPPEIFRLLADQLEDQPVDDIARRSGLSESTIRRFAAVPFDARASSLIELAPVVGVALHAFGSVLVSLDGFIGRTAAYLDLHCISTPQFAKRIGADRSYMRRVLEGDADIGCWFMFRIGQRVDADLHACLAEPAQTGMSSFRVSTGIDKAGELVECAAPGVRAVQPGGNSTIVLPT